MAHRLRFRKLEGVLTFSDWRMIPCDLVNLTAAKRVEARVPDMPDGRLAVLDDSYGQHACHALPLGTARGKTVDLVVGDRDRLADAIGDGAGLALETLADHRERNVGSLAARRLPSHAVDHDEQASRLVNVESILVHIALATRVGRARSGECGERPGGRTH